MVCTRAYALTTIGSTIGRGKIVQTTGASGRASVIRPREAIENALTDGDQCRYRPDVCKIQADFSRSTRNFDHSTVTDLARLRGWSTSLPITTAV
jgi:hypothetical protein